MARMSIRSAATVVVARPGPSLAAPVEILALRRSAESRFAPGFVVFPGGTVDGDDALLAERWFGRPDEVARACAVRELAEETGLVMTRDGLVEATGRLPGEPGLPPPATEDLHQMARWIAPEFVPVRFDATFFAVAASRGLTPTPDGVEIERVWWATPESLLAEASAGDALLMWPTLRTLQELSDCRTVDAVLALQVEAGPPPRLAP
jgi:8-oxo-dGTP pyrophosphatase MutT (NUDIX family)